jgi:hypothetical protein
MTPRQCRYQCGTLLDAWDDDAKKYREAGSGGLHTKERCEEMKAKSRLQQGEKNHNNHGNENSATVKGWIPTKEQAEKIAEETKNYVDHTLGQQAKGQQRFRAFSMPTADQLTKLIDDWIDENEDFIQIRMIGQLQLSADGKTFAIAVYYEEIKQ